MKHISAAHLIALSAMSLPARAEEPLEEQGIEITPMGYIDEVKLGNLPLDDGQANNQQFLEELNKRRDLMLYGGRAEPLKIDHWQEKLPPTRSGNNRPIRTAERRAKNKAARKSRMQQRRKAKKG